MATGVFYAIASLPVGFGGCSREESKPPARQTNATAASVIPPVDPCALLPAATVAAILGEAPRATKPNRTVAGGAVSSSCYFELSTPPLSANVTVLQKGAEGAAPEMRERWAKMFPQEKLVDRERAEGGTKAAPLKIEDLGEEALWAGDARMSALHVLRGGFIITVSVGSAGSPEERRARSKKLAAALLESLP